MADEKQTATLEAAVSLPAWLLELIAILKVILAGLAPTAGNEAVRADLHARLTKLEGGIPTE